MNQPVNNTIIWEDLIACIEAIPLPSLDWLCWIHQQLPISYNNQLSSAQNIDQWLNKACQTSLIDQTIKWALKADLGSAGYRSLEASQPRKFSL